VLATIPVALEHPAGYDRDLFPLCLMGGCGLLVAQMLLSQTIWKKLP
jgi:hypothetical protein